MKIPKSLKIEVCNSCRKNLVESDYKRCGVSFDKPVVYFDYECSKCSHIGRYVLPVATGVPPEEALLHLANLLTPKAPAESSSTKGNIHSDLNKIIGVNDLLKLGGKDAPREPSRDDPTDLP